MAIEIKNSGLEFLLGRAPNITIIQNDDELFSRGSGHSYENEILFGDEKVGLLRTDLKLQEHQELANCLAPLLLTKNFSQQIKVLDWVLRAKQLVGEIGDWIGVYYKASWLLGEDSTDLVLGPFLGESTDHIRIPLNRGFCGMALREQKTVNIDDVSLDSTHIACSLSTKSEIVIPIPSSDGELIAELDIDSNQRSAFDSIVQKKLEEFVKTFPLGK